MALISVIIPLYNKENFIEATLQSALNQTFTDFEIIIVNDGSTDQSDLKVKKNSDPRIQYYEKENEGVSVARNFGIEKASGKMIAFLDADDFWYPTFLEHLVSLTNQFPEEKVFGAAIEIQSSKRIFAATYAIPKTPEVQKINFFSGSLDQALLFTSSVLIEKSVFDTVGNFNPLLKTDEDTELWIRIGLQFPVVFSHKIAARYTYDKKGLSKATTNFSLKTDFKTFCELEKTRPELRKFLSIHRFSMALQCKMNGNNTEFNRFYGLLTTSDLSAKQQFLLAQPSYILRFFRNVKYFLENFNVRLSAFK